MLIRLLGATTAALLLLSARAPLAWANAGVFGGSGQTVRLESTDKIQLRREDVTIVVGRGMFPFDGGVAGMDAVLYDCRFDLVNLTDDDVTVQVGFPLATGRFDAVAAVLADEDAAVREAALERTIAAIESEVPAADK